jgi:hypothetical protein
MVFCSAARSGRSELQPQYYIGNVLHHGGNDMCSWHLTGLFIYQWKSWNWEITERVHAEKIYVCTSGNNVSRWGGIWVTFVVSSQQIINLFVKILCVFFLWHFALFYFLWLPFFCEHYSWNLCFLTILNIKSRTLAVVNLGVPLSQVLLY